MSNRRFYHRLTPAPALLVLSAWLLVGSHGGPPPASLTHPVQAAAVGTAPGGQIGATVGWVIGLTSSVIAIIGFVSKYMPVRQRELFSMYRRSAVSVFGLSRSQCDRVFGDRALQTSLLSPAYTLTEQWAALREALQQRGGVAPAALESPVAFYKNLLAHFHVSEHWRDRAREMADQLPLLTGEPGPPAPASPAPGAVPVPARPAPAFETVPGMATFLFTDIQDSTVFWERLGKRFQPIKEVHDRLLRVLADEHHGREVVTTGDGFFFVFPIASAAIAFSIAVQMAVGTDPDLAAAVDAAGLAGGIKIRIGMHSGERVATDPGTYDGPNTNKAARVCGAGHGGQILVSREAYRDARLNLPTETTCLDLGCYRLKGIADDVDILQVDDPRLPERQFPRLNAASPERVHLPRFLTPFLGRQADVDRLQQLLAEADRRLIVLVGPAGVGKTRLSVQAAGGVAERYPDGVWFIDLEAATGPADVFAQIVHRLALFSQAPESDAERVTKFLAKKKILLVMDNLEQITGPEEALRVLLESSSALQCLASSRERVLLSGSQTYAVAPLPVPEAVMGGDMEALQAVESVRFFLDRARMRGQDFILTPDNAASVAALCRQLEGIPLALELAAAWTTQMTPSEILHEIKTHLDLPGTEYGDLPERQRTVRASIDWSYSRLTPAEQRLFAQLAVFDGGMTPEAAKAIGDVPQTLELLRGLAEKSLLRRQEVHQRTRYRLLNTTRLYADERMGARPDAEQVRERHAAFYADLAQREVARLRTPQERDASLTLEDELDNLKSAMRWAAGAGRGPLAAGLALALGIFLERRGWQREARPYVQQGLDLLRRAGDGQSPLYADLLRAQVSLALDAFEFPQARAEAASLRELGQAQAWPLMVGHAHNLLGIADRCEKLYAEAAANFHQALSCFEGQGDTADAAAVKNNIGVTLMEDPAGDKAQAADWLSQSLGMRQDSGDRRGVAEVLTNLGNLCELAKDFDGAGRRYSEALALEREFQDTFGIARALSNMGEVAEAQGRAEQAYKLYAASQYLFGRVGSPYQSYTQGLRERIADTHSPFLEDQQAAFQSAAEKPQETLVAWAVGDAPAP